MTGFLEDLAPAWRRFAAASLLPLVIAAAMAGPVHADAGFRVLTYNIRTGLGSLDPSLQPFAERKREVDLAPIVAAIRSVGADVVALQEVRGETQAKAIAAALGMHFVYHRHGPKYGKWWGLAVLSKSPILASESLPVSFGEGNTRSDLLIRVEIGAQGESKGVTVVDTHGDKDIKDGSNHKTTMANLAAVTGPLVLLGDFNARPKWKRIKAVRKRLTDAVEIAEQGGDALQEHGTFREDRKLIAGKRIDYVFVDAKRIRVKRVGLIDEAHWDASDHIGVWADLEIKPE